MNRKRNIRLLYYCRKSKNIRTILCGASIWRWAIRDKHLNFREWFYTYPVPSDDDIVELGIRYFRNDGYRTIHTMSHAPIHIRNVRRPRRKLSNFK